MDYSKNTNAKTATGNPRFDGLNQIGAPKAKPALSAEKAALLAKMKAAFEAKKKVK